MDHWLLDKSRVVRDRPPVNQRHRRKLLARGILVGLYEANAQFTVVDLAPLRMMTLIKRTFFVSTAAEKA